MPGPGVRDLEVEAERHLPEDRDLLFAIAEDVRGLSYPSCTTSNPIRRPILTMAGT
jgi:hypothetical protein